MAVIGPRKIRLKDGTELFIRCAQESDASALIEAALALFSDGEGMVVDPDEFSMTEDLERAWICGHNENPRELLLVAEVDGRIVGNIGFRVSKRRRLSHSGEFGMGVQPGWRSRGIGNALLESLIDWARTVVELEKITLKVRADNGRPLSSCADQTHQEGRHGSVT